MASSNKTEKAKRDLDVSPEKVAGEESNTTDEAQSAIQDCNPLDEVTSIIRQLVGNLETHAPNLESVNKKIDEEVNAINRPSIAFKLTDLQTLVHSVIIKVRSYTSTCKDVREFVSNFEEKELQSLEEMLYFLEEMKSFSSPMMEELSAITTALEAATTAIKEQKDAIAAKEAADQGQGDEVPSQTPLQQHQITSAHNTQTLLPNMPQNGHEQRNQSWLFYILCGGRTQSPEQERCHVRKAILDECAKQLRKLDDEVKQIKKNAEKYSRNISSSLKKYETASDIKELSAGIMKIKKECLTD